MLRSSTVFELCEPLPLTVATCMLMLLTTGTVAARPADGCSPTSVVAIKLGDPSCHDDIAQTNHTHTSRFSRGNLCTLYGSGKGLVTGTGFEDYRKGTRGSNQHSAPS